MIATRRQGESVEISFRDDGTGILQTVRPHIFEYFSSGKPVGEGAGLALALAYVVIVKKHNGKIWYETHAGEAHYLFRSVSA